MILLVQAPSKVLLSLRRNSRGGACASGVRHAAAAPLDYIAVVGGEGNSSWPDVAWSVDWRHAPLTSQSGFLSRPLSDPGTPLTVNDRRPQHLSSGERYGRQIGA